MMEFQRDGAMSSLFISASRFINRELTFYQAYAPSKKMLKLTNINYGVEQTYDPGKANYTTHSVWRLRNPLSGLQHQPALHPLYS